MFAEKYPSQLDLSKFGTPTTIIGDIVNVGFSPTSTQARIIEMIDLEQASIDARWDDATMTKTVDLREQLANQ